MTGQTTASRAPDLSPDFIDQQLESVLRAAGSSLRHYTPYSKLEMRDAMKAALLCAIANHSGAA